MRDEYFAKLAKAHSAKPKADLVEEQTRHRAEILSKRPYRLRGPLAAPGGGMRSAV